MTSSQLISDRKYQAQDNCLARTQRSQFSDGQKAEFWVYSEYSATNVTRDESGRGNENTALHWLPAQPLRQQPRTQGNSYNFICNSSNVTKFICMLCRDNYIFFSDWSIMYVRVIGLQSEQGGQVLVPSPQPCCTRMRRVLSIGIRHATRRCSDVGRHTT